MLFLPYFVRRVLLSRGADCLVQATLTGVPQQTAVLAFQFGDGFTNMFVPTSALLMGGLALGRVPYIAWLRFIMPLMIKILLLASVFIMLSIHFPF
jgi:uncharacterized ion transporter superfamily protein YfcC